MGFAQGMQSGIGMGSNLLSLYQQGKQNREERDLREELARVGTMAPTESTDPKDPTKKRFDLLGQTFDVAPDAAQLARAKQLEIANVLERRGLVERGAAIRNAIAAQDATAEDRAHQRALRPLQINAAQRADRTGALQEADDTALRGVGTEVGQFLDQRLTGPDGTKRAVTPDDHVQAQLYRAGALQRAGKSEQAAQAMKEYQAAAYGKLTMEKAERAEAAQATAAGVRAGQFDTFKTFFDKYIPDGSNIASIKPRKDGKVEIVREVGGKPMKPEVMTKEDMLVVIETAVDPTKAWQMTMQLADRAMRQRSEARADRAEGRAAATHAAGAPGRAVENLLAQHKQALLDPKATPDARQAAATALQGYTAAASTKAPTAAKVEAGDVTSLLADPAMDARGRPMMDPMTGRQSVNRNPQREKEFFTFMRAAGLRDTNEGLLAFKSMPEFTTAAQMDAALRAGQIKPGAFVRVGGVIGQAQ